MKLALAVVAGVFAFAGAAPTSTLPMAMTVSPDGAHVAWVDGSTWQVWVADADGANAHRVGASFKPDGVGQLTWTGDGLLVDSNFTLYLLTQKGERVKIGLAGDQMFSAVAGRVASGSADCGFCHGPVTVYNIRTHTAVRVGDPRQANNDPALSPDGTRVAFAAATCGPPDNECDHDRGLFVASLRTGAAHRLGPGGGCNRWSPDGRSLSTMRLGRLYAVSVATGRRTLLLQRAGGCLVGNPPTWSPDSRGIALSYGPGRLAVVDVRTRTVRKTPTRLGRVTGFAWTPDGSALIASFRDSCGDVDRVDAGTLAATVLVRGCP